MKINKNIKISKENLDHALSMKYAKGYTEGLVDGFDTGYQKALYDVEKMMRAKFQKKKEMMNT